MHQNLGGQVGSEVARWISLCLARARFTLFISLVSIILSLALWDGATISFALVGKAVWDGQYWRFITSTFVHGNAAHLISSLVFAGLLGVPLECRYGSWRMMLLYSVLAIGSNAAQYLAGFPGIGMSGVLYGYFGFILAVGDAPNGPKIRFRQLISIVMLLLWAASIILYVRGNVLIGVFSHCAGLVLGLAMGRALRAERPFKRLVLVGLASVALAPATLYMPWSYWWWWHRAEVLQKREDHEQALAAARRAVDMADDDRKVAPLLIHIGTEAVRYEAYEQAIQWFLRAMLVTELPATAKIDMAAAYYETYRDADARWLLQQVNPSDLTAQERDSPYYTWYLEWARSSATQPESVPATDSQPADEDPPPMDEKIRCLLDPTCGR